MASDEPFVYDDDAGDKLCKGEVFFNPDASKVFICSGCKVYVYDAKNGRRLGVLAGGSPQLYFVSTAEHWITFSANGTVTRWNPATFAEVSSERLLPACIFIQASPDNANVLLAVASVNDNFCSVTEVLLTPDGGVKLGEKLVELPKPISKKTSFISNDRSFYVSNKLKINCVTRQKTSSINVFKHSYPNIVNKNSVAVTSVAFDNDTFYAAVNIGQIYYWEDFSKTGFSNTRIFHRHPDEIAFVALGKGVLICGGGQCVVKKWNLAASGVARWQMAQSSEKFDSPIHNMAISPDKQVVAVLLTDNTAWLLQTATMNLINELQTLQWTGDRRNTLHLDPARQDLILTRGRPGFLHWVDPVQQISVGQLDVTEEPSFPRDNVPYGTAYNPVTVYAFMASPTTLFTAEKRFGYDGNTILRFFRRRPQKFADVYLEDAIDFSGTVNHAISTNGDLDAAEALAAVKEEEFIIVDRSGMLHVYVRDSDRQNRWQPDLSRCVRWMDTAVKSTTSSVRSNCLAAIHALESGAAACLVWRVDTMTVHQAFDQMGTAHQVNWAPKGAFTGPDGEANDLVLIIATIQGFFAFDLEQHSVLWIVQAPFVSLVPSAQALVIKVNNKFSFIDPPTGKTQITAVVPKPDHRTERSVVTNYGNKACITSISQDGTPTFFLQPPSEGDRKKTTETTERLLPHAFVGEDTHNRLNEPAKNVKVNKNFAISNFLDGASYTAASFTLLATSLIENSLFRVPTPTTTA